jgi:hypothetical protein
MAIAGAKDSRTIPQVAGITKVTSTLDQETDMIRYIYTHGKSAALDDASGTGRV